MPRSRPPAPRNRPVEIAGVRVTRGRRPLVGARAARLPTPPRLNLPIMVLNGQRPGPRLWLSAVVHGDELNGLEIVRRVLEVVRPRQLAGTLLAVPVVNVFGMVTETRYLPDRRDLNRSFPGSANGSVAAQLAHLFMTNVVAACDMGIDLHTGSDSRFNETAISAGVDGVLRVLADLEMRTVDPVPPGASTTVVRHTHWLRARRTGILRSTVRAGQRVDQGDALWHLADLDPGAKGTAARTPRGR